MATTPTTNPIPSESPRDLKFNAGKIDEFVNSANENYTDRFGAQRFTIEGLRHLAREAIAAFGYVTVDSFEDGATITLPNQVLRYESTGDYYRWDGQFPKVVPAGSTPQSSGGVSLGAWISVGDSSLRAALAQSNGSSLVGFGSSTVYDSMVKDVRWYGAKGDGVSDDSAAFQAAADNGSVVMTPGNYLVSSDITITPVETPNLAQGKAFYLEWPEDFEHGFVQRGSFFNVAIRGQGEYEAGFETCVHMHQGDNINFFNNEFKGAGGNDHDQARNTRSKIGVRITGRYSPVEYRFIGNYFGSLDIAIRPEDTAEGMYITENIFIDCKVAVYWSVGYWSPSWPVTPGTRAIGRPLLVFAHNHVNCFQYAVFTDGVSCIHEHDNLVYHSEGALQNGIGFVHDNGTEIFNKDNEVWGFNSTYFIDGCTFLANASFGRCSGLRLVAAAPNSAKYGVELRSGSSHNEFGSRGGFFYATGAQAVASGPQTAVNFGARDYDADVLWSGSGPNITIPAGVGKVRLTGAVLFDSAATSSARELYFLNNGGLARGMGQQSVTSVAGKGTYMNITSADVLVTPGDVITMNVRHDDGVSRSLQPNATWMQVEILG
ncbi:hypothetical protein GH714_044115 [Hevea brasiliensis]|uniref:Pectate lyase superfamily protein domain-containing protein n=1 Tax=Hevea brasiliensis TaxID=3981 RepID=A0A6A6K0W2_HEVBR|nr:hypothetical protein GH714_044115 [Hevea brasiliensis]